MPEQTETTAELIRESLSDSQQEPARLVANDSLALLIHLYLQSRVKLEELESPAWSELEGLREELSEVDTGLAAKLARIISSLRGEILGVARARRADIVAELRERIRSGDLPHYPNQRRLPHAERRSAREFLAEHYAKHFKELGADQDLLCQADLRELDEPLLRRLEKELGSQLREVVPTYEDWNTARVLSASPEEIANDPGLAAAALRRALKTRG